jgi:hypothetical protein
MAVKGRQTRKPWASVRWGERISSAQEQMQGMLMLRSASCHGGLAAEMMARASSGTGTLYRIGMRIWHGIRVRERDTAHHFKVGWAVVDRTAPSEQVVYREVQRQVWSAPK